MKPRLLPLAPGRNGQRTSRAESDEPAASVVRDERRPGLRWPTAVAVRPPACPGNYPDSSGSRDIYSLYLREIGQVQLLSPAEEAELAARVRQGDAAAREKMITANLRLVVKIARQYDGYGVPLLDLISEGNIGLMKAVEHYDPAKGAKLSSYAAWWIKQAIRRALANQGKTIRLPVHLVDKIAHLRRIAAKRQEALGREPTDEELGEAMGLHPGKVARLREAANRPASLDRPLNQEDEETLASVVADENGRTPDQEIERDEAARALGQVLRSLSARERTVLSGRFGLEDGTERTLEEMGRRIGLTRERVRQIQVFALAKLRQRLEGQKGMGTKSKG